MTHRNLAYKDANFRKAQTHMVTKHGDRIDCTCYSYESKSKLYDIVVPERPPGSAIVRTNMKRDLPGPAHREIDRFFNLNLNFEE